MRNEEDILERRRMVRHDLRARGIHDERVLMAMETVPRRLFVLPEYRDAAYADAPLPIGGGQTISQPYMVALMTEALSLEDGERVLEIGTGSGYQAAVLAELGAQVWSIDRSETLSARASDRLQRLGYEFVRCIVADGTLGWPEGAPFDRIIATGSLPGVPHELLKQLAKNGVFVGPIGTRHEQMLERIVVQEDGLRREKLCGCRFVPLIGENGWQY
jgi:protein-L-isoaspartate(D-aspartate) O-methyltransferase